MSIELLNIDCMEYMAGLEDNAFDLAIVDPPYGIGACGMKLGHRDNSIKTTNYKAARWDDAIPTTEYWEQLFRVSRHQIVWGGNHFTEYLRPRKSWIVWDKKQPAGASFAQHELAWSSIDFTGKIFSLSIASGSNRNSSDPSKAKYFSRIHPTQKPIKLYNWLLSNYAKEGDRILDTHLGSGSSAIAAHYGGFDFVGCEIDEDYYRAACERFDNETRQEAMF